MNTETHEENTIISQLENFQPRPGKQIYQQISHAPWAAVGNTSRFSLSPRNTRIVAGMVLFLTLAAGVMWLTPSLRAFAAQVIQSLFHREPANSIVVQPAPSVTRQIALSETLTDVASIEARAGFEVHQPQSIPGGYQFIGAGYTESRHTVSLVYQRPGAEFTLTQQPVEFAEYGLLTDYARGIGADAPVETVQIGDISGEYVAGFWIMTAENTAVWKADVPFQRLRWRDGSYIYEIFTKGGSSDTGSFIDRDALIAMATGLQ